MLKHNPLAGTGPQYARNGKHEQQAQNQTPKNTRFALPAASHPSAACDLPRGSACVEKQNFNIDADKKPKKK